MSRSQTSSRVISPKIQVAGKFHAALAAALLISAPAFAVNPFNVPESFPKMDGLVLTSNNFEGCSASLLAFEGYTQTDPALILTNGHCTGKGVFMGNYPGAKDVFQNTSPTDNAGGSLDVYLYTKKSQVIQTRASKLVFGTMSGSDIAIYELPYSYEELEKRELRPMILESNPVLNSGDKISLVSSYWKTAYSCTFDASVSTLKEGIWTWKNAMRILPENCPIQNGASGSPLINSAGKIIGIINTVNMDGETCTLNNPCEVEDGRPVVHQRMNYGFFLSGLYQCLDASRRLDFTQPSCPYGKE